MVLKKFFWLTIVFTGLFCSAFVQTANSPSLFELNGKKARRILEKRLGIPKQSVWVNVTADFADYLMFNNLEAELYRIQNDDTGLLLVLGRSNACHEGGCERSSFVSSGRFEHFDYLVVVEELKAIKRIDILRYDAEYGYEICSKPWLSQFFGEQSAAFVYGEDVSAISGATVSGMAMTNEVNKILALMKDLAATKELSALNAAQ